jgi:hypothetical protein
MIEGHHGPVEVDYLIVNVNGCDFNSWTSNLVTGTMKIINAMSDTPGMTKEEVERFLESESILQIATLDRKG